MMTERISLSTKLRISLSVEIATVWGDVRLNVTYKLDKSEKLLLQSAYKVIDLTTKIYVNSS